MQPYRSYFVGPMSRYSTLITYAKSIHMFGIRFLPCGLFRFMQLPLEELGNQRISTFESEGIFNDSLAERLCEQPYIQDKIRLIESFLTQALCTNNKIEKQISYAVDCINLSKGQLPIRSLVEKVVFLQRSHPGVSYFCTVSNTKKKQWNHLKKKQKLCFNNVK